MSNHVSASQLQKYRRCKRLIGFEYVEKLAPPPSAKQSFGSAVHAQLERWLKDGKEPEETPAGDVAKQGIEKGWLPDPGSGLLVERQIHFEWRNGIEIMGFVDCAVPDQCLVIDHKTTSNLRFAMTADQLRQDPQALIYAAWAAVEWDVNVVTARWVYYAASNPAKGPRRPKGGRSVEATFDFATEEVRELVRELDRDINNVYNVKAKSVPGKDLPPSPAACSAYGGCPHRELCDLNGGSLLAAYLSD